MLAGALALAISAAYVLTHAHAILLTIPVTQRDVLTLLAWLACTACALVGAQLLPLAPLLGCLLASVTRLSRQSKCGVVVCVLATHVAAVSVLTAHANRWLLEETFPAISETAWESDSRTWTLGDLLDSALTGTEPRTKQPLDESRRQVIAREGILQLLGIVSVAASLAVGLVLRPRAQNSWYWVLLAVLLPLGTWKPLASSLASMRHDGIVAWVGLTLAGLLPAAAAWLCALPALRKPSGRLARHFGGPAFPIAASAALIAAAIGHDAYTGRRVRASALAVGTIAPVLTGIDAAGHAVRVGSGPERLVVVGFWATWCQACGHQVDWMRGLHGDPALEPVAIHAVTLSEDRDVVLASARQKAIDDIVLVADEASARRYRVGALPLTLILDESGHILRRYVGFGDAERRDAEALLGERAATSP